MDTGNTGVAVSWGAERPRSRYSGADVATVGEYFPGHLQAFDGLLARRWAIQIPRVTKELKATDDWVEVRIEF
jgi:hypothetical protein